MEFLDGIPFNRPEASEGAGATFDELAHRGARIFLDMIFRDGFFHADPHPGNVLYLRPDRRAPGWNDRPSSTWGWSAGIDDRMRDRIERGTRRGDCGRTPRRSPSYRAGRRRPHAFDPAALEAEVAEQLAFYHGMPLEQFQLGTALNELTDAIRRYHVCCRRRLRSSCACW